MCTRVMPIVIGVPSASTPICDATRSSRAACRIARSGIPSEGRDRNSSCARRSDVGCTVQPSASAARIASSTACSLSTGSAPGSARHTGQVFAFGGAPKSVEQPQKIFVARLELDVHLEPDDHLVRVVPALRGVTSSVRLRAERAFERVRARRTSCRSSKCRAMNCPPTGSPSTRPIGTDIAGTPARFAVTVKMSLRYISYGSRLRAERKRRRRRRRREQQMHAAREHVREIPRDERAHLLRLS